MDEQSETLPREEEIEESIGGQSPIKAHDGDRSGEIEEQTGDLDSSTDQNALLSFKHQLNDPRNALSGWKQNSSHCNWFGVLCSNGSRVESLQLSGLGLAGTLNPSLSNLTFLHTLNLSHNFFHGQFDLEFNRLSLLQHIDLRNNSINGTVPALLSTCHNLETLRFNGNRFSGHLPSELGNLQKLTRLEISINNLTGSLPSSYGNLSSLTNLRFARNKLSGEIPSEFGQLRNLQQIQLSDNNLSGQIPHSIFNITSLVYISLTLNNLSGNLPNDMGQTLPNLRELYLATNRFDGIIPVSLSNASNIEALDLSRNDFHGPIPLLGNMKKLIMLDLGHNFLSSTTARNSELVDSLSSCKQLEILRINSNQLSGEFPSVANLSRNMQHFCIGDNFLTGPLPQGMDKFQNLISLSIEQNSFTGEVPMSLATLRKSQSFLVYQNMLSGEIPEIFANFTQVFVIAMGNNKFSGRIPTTLGSCGQLQVLDLSRNTLNGSIPEEIFLLSGCVMLICFISCFVWAFISKKKKKMGKGSKSSSLPLKGLPPMISYSDIRHGTSNFADENLIGKGGFGSVYKAADENQISETVDPRLFKTNLNTCSNIDSSSRSSSGSINSSINSEIDHRATAKYEECLAAVIRVGLSCAAQSPKDRLSMREALTKLHEIKNSAIYPLDSN
ncbi:hypothetical protein COLO4_33232 [Corchorus olitorius]|uniref:Uncharacterized protein n=1 Tax=Corchorus olitorius TaxID=93759 RepID=A0A1R3GVH2_9ROSI|nr:hypothetical protein COLO4_33232 [Corchorus olitorius]